MCALVCVHSRVVVSSRSRNCKRACVCACMCVYIHRLMNTGLRIRDACPLQSWRIFPFHDDLHIACRNCCGVGLVSFFLCAHYPRFVRLCFYARKGAFFQSTLILRGYVAMCRRWSCYCCSLWLEHLCGVVYTCDDHWSLKQSFGFDGDRWCSFGEAWRVFLVFSRIHSPRT